CSRRATRQRRRVRSAAKSTNATVFHTLHYSGVRARPAPAPTCSHASRFAGPKNFVQAGHDSSQCRARAPCVARVRTAAPTSANGLATGSPGRVGPRVHSEAVTAAVCVTGQTVWLDGTVHVTGTHDAAIVQDSDFGTARQRNHA